MHTNIILNIENKVERIALRSLYWFNMSLRSVATNKVRFPLSKGFLYKSFQAYKTTLKWTNLRTNSLNKYTQTRLSRSHLQTNTCWNKNMLKGSFNNQQLSRLKHFAKQILNQNGPSYEAHKTLNKKFIGHSEQNK